MTENICRICLKTLKTRSRYVTIHEKYKNLTLAVLFVQTTGFNIEANEPQILCNDCRLELIQCFQFIQKCKKTQENLKNLNDLHQVASTSNQKTVVIYYEEKVFPDVTNCNEYLESFDLQPEMVKVEVDTIEERVVAESIIKVEKDNVDCDIKSDTQDSDFNNDENELDDFQSCFESKKTDTTTMVACIHCGQSFKKRNLSSHIEEVHLGKLFLFCDLCPGKSFPKKRLIQHMRQVHLKEQFSSKKHCIHCGKIFFTKRELSKHIKVVHPEKLYFFCDLCPGKSFPIRDRIIQHMKQVHLKHLFSKEEPCIHCGKRFTQLNLSSHIHAVHSTKRKLFCDLCPGKSFSRSRLIQHMKQVHLKEQYSTKKLCIHCGKKFFTKRELSKHLKVVHPEKLYYFCDICPGKSFPTRDRILSHMRQVHLKHLFSKKEPCIHCGERFGKRNLSRHLKAVHPEKFYVFCDLCSGKSFPTMEQLVRHMKGVHLKAQYSSVQLCSLCGAVFKSKQALNTHQRKMHTELFPLLTCPKCPFKTANANSLDWHAKRHLAGDYPCKVCDKIFSTEERLKKHLPFHSEKRQFACDVCDLRFTNHKSARAHIRLVHEKAFTYNCPVCNKRFQTPSGVWCHCKKYHPDYQMVPRVSFRKSINANE